MKMYVGDKVKCSRCGHTWYLHKAVSERGWRACNRCGSHVNTLVSRRGVFEDITTPKRSTCKWFRRTPINALKFDTKMLGRCQHDGLPIYDMSVCLNCVQWESR